MKMYKAEQLNVDRSIQPMAWQHPWPVKDMFKGEDTSDSQFFSRPVS